MSKQLSILGVKNQHESGLRVVEQVLPSWAKAVEMRIEKERFKLGSLDTMLQSLDRITKQEQMSEAFLKKLEKLY